MTQKPWLTYALVTTLFWGLWGAFIDLPEKAGFPATLSYVVWCFTMVPCALVALHLIDWNLDCDRRSLVLGFLVGVLGSGGQLLLFEALRTGPAYLIFPVVSLAPAVTTLLSWMFLHEPTSGRERAGITLALVGIPLLSYQPAGETAAMGYLWLVLSIVVFLAWGVQAFYLKTATRTMESESIFFYMMVGGLLLIPIAALMTDRSRPINWGWNGPWMAAGIQLLNSVGALYFVYAFRYGKAIVVSPLTNAVAPVITVLVSLALFRAVPHPVVATGMIMAAASMFLLAMAPESSSSVAPGA